MGDMYSIYDYVPAEGVNRQIDQGLGTAGQAYQQYQQNYSPEFKAHLQRVLEGGEDPVAVARELKGKMSGQPQQPQQPQGMPAFGSASGAGAMMSGMGAPQPQQMPQSMPSFSRQGGLGQMQQPQQAPQAQMPQVRTVRGPEAEAAFAPPQQQMSQQQGPQPQYLRTDADVRGGMSMMPYMQAKKSSQQPRDYMGEENNKQRNRLGLEDKRQEGRVRITDMRSAERQLEQAAELAYKSGVLDETTAYHLDSIQLGYAKLRSMENMLDRNIDYKRESGADEKLRAAQRTVASMYSSRAALIGSAFARTPEGQQMLMGMDDVLDVWQPLLNDYGTGAHPVTPTATTTTVTGNTRRGGTSNPGAVKKWKNTKTGAKTSGTDAQLKAAKNPADWVEDK